MVVRFWSARTTVERFPHYLRHFREHVLPHLRSFDGFREARVVTQSDEIVVHFIVETVWSSFEAIDRFTGPDRGAAIVAQEALDILTSYDHRVQHFSVDLYESQSSQASSSSASS
jgi:heme-degrading monooxygenase HmoA